MIKLKLDQLWLDFRTAIQQRPAEKQAATALPTERIAAHERPPLLQPKKEMPEGGSLPAEGVESRRDAVLEQQCRDLLLALGLEGATKLVHVIWNERLTSTAGYAAYPDWRIELNPRLREFEGQVDRTLKHELAHLIAYLRAGRRRIEPHGKEWRQACCDVGIPGEKSHHRLPLPRRQVKRNYAYACPVCGMVVQRVRKFRRHTACLACCKLHNHGQYDRRFEFVLLDGTRPIS